MGFGLKGGIFSAQIGYVEKSKLNFVNMWLIFIDHVTFFTQSFIPNDKKMKF